MRRVTSREGDMVDLIAWTAYGHREGTAEAVLAANPGLGGLGPVLPAGIEIALPDLSPPPAPRQVRLWE